MTFLEDYGDFSEPYGIFFHGRVVSFDLSKPLGYSRFVNSSSLFIGDLPDTLFGLDAR